MAKKDQGKTPKGKTSERKAPERNKSPAPSVEADDAAAKRRVALLRHKLTQAMGDPLMRDQIVKAIRSMLTEGK